MAKIALRILVLAVVATVAAGCGAAARRPLSAEQFGARAGAICQDLQHRLTRIGGPADPSAFAHTLAQGLPTFRAAIGDLRKLAPPTGMRSRVARWLRAYDAMLHAMSKVAARHTAPAGWWSELAPLTAATENGAWDVGAYGCVGRGASAPPKLVRIRYPTTTRQVVIDTDMGSDDWMAILYLLRRPDVNVRAITVSGTGLAHCGPGVRNVRRLLALADRPSVPVTCGRQRPLRGARAFPRAWRRRADTLLGLTLPSGRGADSGRRASELISAAVRSAPDAVDLLTLGPLTNVAEAFRRDPALPRRLHGVYVMGGAVAAAGNAPGNAAEWNFYVDSTAASAVLRSGARITLVPLDATRHAPLDRSFYEGLRRTHRTPVARFVYDVLTRQRAAIDSGTYSFWDPLAAGVLTDGLASFERSNLTVATRGSLPGWLSVASGGPPVRVAVNAPRERFERIFLTVLNRGST